MTPEIARLRARVILEIRSFFTEQGYLEVDTPLLSPHLIPEASIEVFAADLRLPGGGGKELYLVPSPEVWMKPLLAGGYGNIFQVSKCFRNGEQQGRQHNPEFTMLEWYALDSGSKENITITEALFQRMIPFGLPPAARPPFRRMSMDEACLEFAGFDPSSCPDIQGLTGIAEDLQIFPNPDESWESVFNRIFLQFVEPNLPQDRPLVLYDYPAGIPCLARLRDDGLHRDRWELYAGGFECANCFAEETDPSRAAEYFTQAAEEKKHAAVPHRVDDSWPEIYDGSHSPASGVALGVDRLLAIILGRSSIQGVIFFPFCDILGGNTTLL